jgi:opacity protein-like surface antigen
MLKRLMFGIAAVALSLSVSSTAHAQAHFGVSAGISLPQSTFGDDFNSGYNVTGLLQYSMPLSPIGLRAELGYNSFDVKGGGAKARVLDGAANVILGSPAASMFKPYVTAGLGAYNTKITFDDASLAGFFGSPSQTKLGFNGGVGLSVGLTGFQMQLEARYVYVTADKGNEATKYVPISVGVMF